LIPTTQDQAKDEEMEKPMKGGAWALPLMLAAYSAPAYADHAEENIVAIGQRADEHGPAGMMGEHVHKRGEVMIGVTWMHDEYGGLNKSGTRKVSDMAIAEAGFTARTRKMTMDMVMLHLMWAPTDRVTLTLMPSWMRMEMTMAGIGMPGHHGMGSGGHGHHGPAPGETMTHSVSGIGDTEAGALLSLVRQPGFDAHAGLAVSIPTGSVSRRNHDGTFVHYGMQPGSGTWDVIPSLTLGGGGESWSWGAQARYRHRAESRNSSGFRFGHKLNSSVWLTRPLSPAAALTARLAYQIEGRVKGHYDGAHNHAAPPDRQENYGGKLLEAGFGGNLIVGGNLRIGAEVTIPLHQDLNGFQTPKQFGASLNLSRMF
jgi:hypothetical protein